MNPNKITANKIITNKIRVNKVILNKIILNKIIIWSLMILFLSFNVNSIMLYPSKIIFEDQNISEKDLVFTILNDEKTSMIISIITENNELIIEFDKEQYNITANMEELKIPARLKIPENIPPGTYQVKVSFQQQSSQSDTISTSVSLSSRIILNVPFPGKYLESDFKYQNKNIIISLFNRGLENLEEIRGKIKIVNNDTIISTLEDNTFLAVGEQGKFSFPFELPVGNNSVFVTIKYDDNLIENKYDFFVEEKILEEPKPSRINYWVIILIFISLLIIINLVLLFKLKPKRTGKKKIKK